MKPVLFVSHSKRGLFYYNDASARYRCVFPAEELIAKGEQAHTIHFSQIKNVKLTDYKKVIFHRPQYSFTLRKTLKTLKRNSIEHWVDFDDLLFCPELSDTSAAVQSGKMSAELAKKQAKRYLKGLLLFTNIQVSTDELADQLEKHITKNDKPNQINRQIKISYNKVPERWVKQAAPIPAKERLKKKIIRYLPGTSHHKHDFAHIEAFLATLLHNNPNYHLNVIGELEFDHSKFPAAQISTTPFQPFEQLPSLINDSWVIIAPLVDNIFNRCKSGLKFWESGIFGIPVISSPLKDIERLTNKGMCISDSLSVWSEYIKIMETIGEYQKASDAAYEMAQNSVIKQPALNHRYIFIALAKEFGIRWPATILNPTSSNANNISNRHEQLIQKIEATPLEHQLVNQILTIADIEKDSPSRRSSLERKTKKLIRSPKDFVSDSKLMRIIKTKNQPK